MITCRPVERIVADAADVARMVRRIAHEIVEKSRGVEGLVLVGIRTGGLPLAQRLRAVMQESEGAAPPVGAIDIALYRDDVGIVGPQTRPGPRVRAEVGRTELPATLEGRRVVLVDDVLYTGRTVRAALDALMDYGRPTSVRLAVLVDRGLRELPIQADFVGMAIDTSAEEKVSVTEDKVCVSGRTST